MSGSDPGSFGKLTIVAFVIPRDEAGMDALLKLKTVNIVEICPTSACVVRRQRV